MIKKILIILLILVLLSSFASAGTLQTRTYPAGATTINIVGTATDLPSQIIINIPKEALENTQYIDQIVFRSGRGFGDYIPDGNLIIRIYSYDPYSGYIWLDGYNIAPHLLGDLGQQIRINLYDRIEVMPGKDYAVGFYTTATAGNIYLTDLSVEGDERWEIEFMPWQLRWHDKEAGYRYTKEGYKVADSWGASKTPGIADEFISNVSRNFYTYYVSSVWELCDPCTIVHMNFEVIGFSRIPDTPVPTPPPEGLPGDGDVPLPGECTWMDMWAGLCENPLPDFEDFHDFPDYNETYNFTKPKQELCPDCIGNETIEIPGDTIPSDKGFSQFLKGLGYCKEQGCDVYDLIDFAYDFSIMFIILSFILVILKFIKHVGVI